MGEDQGPSFFRRRLRKTGRLARTVAGAGVKRLVGRRDDRAFGEALLAQLDEMKGMAMKVGQILSYLDGVLPEDAQAAMRRLQTGVEPMGLDTVDGVLEEALGGTSEGLFERFDTPPVAAASIGQVHRACHAGREVAVKVQYPGVRETFDTDMQTLHRLARLASLATAVDGAAIVEELHDRLEEECDYRREAAWQRAWREAFAADDRVRIPQVIPERSTERVLTTAWCEGEDLYTVAERADRQTRDRVAGTLLRFTWRSLLVHQAIQADPHPGNFRVAADGALICLDFGCIRRFDPAFLEAWSRVIRCVVEDRREGFVEAVHDTGMVGSERFDFDAWWDMHRWMFEPYCVPSYVFHPGWVEEGRRFTGPTSPNARHMAVPPPWIWLARLWTGLHSVCIRLGARGRYRQLLLEQLDRASDPLDP